MPKVKINDVEVEVPAGTNMIEAAAKVGVEIPHYCYHPHLSIAGNCRMCLVDIEAGGRGPDIACNMVARDGLHIRTDTERVVQMRKSVMEMLLVNHPLDCPICDQSGECRLQDYYMDYGQHESRLTDAKENKKKRQDIGEHIVLDAERCVQCSRCVRFGDEVTGTGELRLMDRTNHTEIGMFPGERLGHAYQGCLADICPVGALTNKEFRFQKRVWYLDETDSICTACSRGCNIKVCHENGQVFRYLPRRNDDVNQSWMCDPGRATHNSIGGLGRILRARMDGRQVEVPDAIEALATALKGAGSGAALVLGAKASNEANWAFLKVFRDSLPSAGVYAVPGNDPGSFEYHDDILVTLDKNPNTRGVATLAAWDGRVGDQTALQAALTAGEIKVLLVLDDDVVGRLGGLPAGVRLVFAGSGRNSTSDKASVVLPGAAHVEQDATFTNGQGRVQRVRRALHPAGDSQAGYLLADGLGAALGKAPGTAMAAATFGQLAGRVPAFKGMDYRTLGAGGLDLVVPAPPPVAVEAQAPSAK
jgi:NADH-quinone oxidoreductase subunit G